MTVRRGLDPGVLRCRIELVLSLVGGFCPIQSMRRCLRRAALNIIRFVAILVCQYCSNGFGVVENQSEQSSVPKVGVVFLL